MTFLLVFPYALIPRLITVFIRYSKIFDVFALNFNIELSRFLIYPHMQHDIVIVILSLFLFILLYHCIDLSVYLSQGFVTVFNGDGHHIVLIKGYSINRVGFKKLAQGS